MFKTIISALNFAVFVQKTPVNWSLHAKRCAYNHDVQTPAKICCQASILFSNIFHSYFHTSIKLVSGNNRTWCISYLFPLAKSFTLCIFQSESFFFWKCVSSFFSVVVRRQRWQGFILRRQKPILESKPCKQSNSSARSAPKNPSIPSQVALINKLLLLISVLWRS